MKKLILMIIPLIIIAIIIKHTNTIGVNISHSVPFTLYTINKHKKEFREGDYVLFHKQADPLNILPKNAKLVKMIACGHGSFLQSIGDAWYCNGQKIAVIRDPKVMQFRFSGNVPAGKMFMTGEAFRSYDSRIWGFLDDKNIISGVDPLF